MNEKMVRVKAMKRGRSSLTAPSANLKRTWAKRGAVHTIPLGLLEQAIFDPGVEYLFKTGILFIEDLDARIRLGLEEEGTTEETAKMIPLTEDRMKELLFKTPFRDFRETVEAMTISEAEELANAAIEEGLTDYQRCKILTDKTSKEILKIVLREKEEEEIDKE